MLRDPEEIAVNGLIWLYPQTQQASRNVHRMLACRVLKDPKAHWPMVVVGWTENGADRWELVHKDNIRKKAPGAITSKAEAKQGDSIGDGGTTRRGTNRVRVMPGARKYAPADGQETLF